MKGFEDTEIWKAAIGLSRLVYKLTKSFPYDEQFGLTSQIKRAVNSVSANFAEGYGRFSKKDKHHFYVIAHGSLLEVKSFVYLSNELGFTDIRDTDNLLEHINELEKQLNSLKKSIRT